MIQVHIWNYRGLKTAMGHASMHVGASYISWWPAGTSRRFKIPTAIGRAVPLYSVDHIHGQSFDDDKLLEALDANSIWDATLGTFVDSTTGLMVKPMDPDHTITIDGLDEGRILTWWSTFNVPGRQWSTLGQNCATTVGRALMMGGGDDYALGASGWWHSWNMVWQPNDALRYAQAIARGLGVRAGEHEAINFVRRFVTSPLGLTSVSWSVDEQAMADA
ncbi:MAG: hypothetical protein HKN21_04005, partial [Candidatus Eisenbacteria bacterium]|nr:hypothetical protein [Candidatus Eisenbacteria bacterium]